MKKGSPDPARDQDSKLSTFIISLIIDIFYGEGK